MTQASTKIALLQQVITELDPDAAKENGAPIADADAGGAALDDNPALWFPLFEKIEQAARATRTKNVLATTALPFGKRNAETMTVTTLRYAKKSMTHPLRFFC